VGADVSDTFCFVPFVSGRRIHNLYDRQGSPRGQADCIYNLLLGII
jgi:hypothetical protein